MCAQTELREREAKSVNSAPSVPVQANRVFYMAIPPTIFVDVGKGIQPAAMSKVSLTLLSASICFARFDANLLCERRLVGTV